VVCGRLECRQDPIGCPDADKAPKIVVTLALLAALDITLLVLFLTVLRVRDPTTRVVSTQLSGIAPRLAFPAVSLQLNVTLLLVVPVHNPNPASFTSRGAVRCRPCWERALVGSRLGAS
jgi:hypothetical protein